jgi:hypothetical protein
VRASLVGLFGVYDGFSCFIRCCGVGATMECRCGNDDGNRWPVEDLVGASPAFFFLRGSSSKSKLSLVGACCHCWHVAMSAGGDAQYSRIS